MRVRTAAKFLDLFSVILIIVQLILITSAIYAGTKTYRAYNMRFESVRLSEQLRHSSRDLTTFARAFVATGDKRFMLDFHETLNVRNGIKPRNDGRTIPLRVLLAEAGFQEDELRLLDIAERKSNELTQVELNAMKLVQTTRPGDFTAARLRSIDMLYNVNYRRQVQEIMEPIFKFEESVSQRTLLEAQRYDFTLKTLLVLIAGLLIVSTFVLYISGQFKIKNNHKEV